MARENARGRDDISDLFEIKHIIEKSSTTMPHVEGEGNINKIYSELDKLNGKFNELRDIVVGIKKRGDSLRKRNVKREIIALLQKNKRMDSYRLGGLIGLSRVRANEYLKELENEKIVKGLTIKRKRFYALESDLVGKAYMEKKSPE